MTAMTYTMSKDYDALYEHLCAGGEALGRHGHLPLRMYRHIDRLFIVNRSEPYEVFDIGIGEAAFKSTCTRLSLEWLAPVDLAGVLEAGDAMANSIDEHIEQHVGSTKTPFGTEQDMGHARSEWTDATAKFRKQP